MPRIPLSEGQQILPQRHDAVHAPMAIAGDFGMENSRALMNAADRIRGAGEKIAGAGLAFASALVDKENRLAAAEDRNLFLALNGELRDKLANTPGASDEEKTEWIQGYKQKYEDERKPFLDKMSEGFRKQHDAEMLGVRIRAQSERLYILNQGKVQRLTDQWVSQYKYCAERNDKEGCQRLLVAARAGKYPLFSAEKLAEFERDYQHLADFGAAKRAVDANDPNIDVKLRERDENGNYTHFTNITTHEREQLARAAKVNRHELEFERNQAFLAGLNDGSIIITSEDLKAQHDQKEISDAEFNTRMPWVKQKENERKAEAKLKKNALKEQKRLDEQKKKKQSRLELDAFCFDLEKTIIYSGAYANAKQEEYLLNLADNLFSSDLDTKQKARAAVRKRCQDAKNNKDISSLRGGAEVLTFIEQNYRNDSGYEGLKWDPDGSQKDKSQTFMKAKYHEILVMARDCLIEGMSAADVISRIKEKVALLNDGQIYNVISGRNEEAKNGRGYFKNFGSPVRPVKYYRTTDNTLIREYADGSLEEIKVHHE